MAEPGGEIGIGKNRRAGFLGDLDGVADVVAVSVGQEDMGDALGRVLEVLTGKARIMGQERIDKNDRLCRFDAEGGVA
jgi:VIT1/CCC1 family predicted Fe2+/Mn2+ transporter